MACAEPLSKPLGEKSAHLASSEPVRKASTPKSSESCSNCVAPGRSAIRCRPQSSTVVLPSATLRRLRCSLRCDGLPTPPVLPLLLPVYATNWCFTKTYTPTWLVAAWLKVDHHHMNGYACHCCKGLMKLT